jgi:ribonuclease HI
MSDWLTEQEIKDGIREYFGNFPTIAYCDGSNFVGRGSGAGVYVEESYVYARDHRLDGFYKMVPSARISVPLNPNATNNEAEYQAVITALEYFVVRHSPLLSFEVRQDGPTPFTVYSDSELVIKQINGDYKVREPRLKLLHSKVLLLLTEFGVPVDFKHIRREMNEHADLLARMGSMLSPTHSNG